MSHLIRSLFNKLNWNSDNDCRYGQRLGSEGVEINRYWHIENTKTHETIEDVSLDCVIGDAIRKGWITEDDLETDRHSSN